MIPSHAREADAAMGVLQQQIGDATQHTDVLLQAIAETHQKAQEAGRIAVSGAAGVAQTRDVPCSNGCNGS